MSHLIYVFLFSPLKVVCQHAHLHFVPLNARQFLSSQIAPIIITVPQHT